MRRSIGKAGNISILRAGMGIPFYTLAVALLVVGVSCKTSEGAKGERQVRGYQALAELKYGRRVDFIMNSTGTAVLCVSKSKPTQLQPQQQISFFVFDMKTESVLHEDSVPNGWVSWENDNSVIVVVTPGTVRDEDKGQPERAGYVFDLRTRKTRDLGKADVR